MKYNTFYSHKLKCEVRQINARTAKKLFENGKGIFFQSSNMTFDNVWHTPFFFNIECSNDQSFETLCNSYRYYNCDNYRGKYINYFVRVSDFS